jgi:hypothetical protein
MNAGHIELTIRKTRFGGLKSPAGTRRLPLSELLDHKETVFLREWLADRPLALPKSGEQLLFCDGSDPMAPLSEAEVFEPIRAALIAATGDPEIRFHNLRHSFATFLLLTLTVPPTENLCWLKGVDAGIVSSSRRVRLGFALFGEGRTGRAALHAVSQACGHSDVRVTLASYMHLADLALWSLLSRHSVQPPIPTATKAALGGITKPAVRVLEHRQRKKKGVPKSTDPAGRVDEGMPTLDSHRDAPRRKVRGPDGVHTRRSIRLVKTRHIDVPCLPPINLIQQAMEAQHAGHTPEDCARSLGGSVDDITRWFERAKGLGAMQTQKGGFRHRSVGRATTENILFPSAAIEKKEAKLALAMWTRIGAEIDGIERNADALRIFAQRFQSTGSRVRIDNLQERTAYETLLTSLGVTKARVVWTKSPGETGTRSNPANRKAANDIRGSISIKSAKNNSASAGFHYALRMLIIAGDFSFI